MVEIKYIGTHQPVGMIVDVDEIVAQELINTEEYEEVLSKTKSKIIKEEVVVNDSKRTSFRR